MTLLQSLLRITNFRNPFLRTLVPSVGLIFALQLGVAAPSIALHSERFYDASGSLTYLAATVLSLYLPALRARAAAAVTSGVVPQPPLPSLVAPFTNPGGTAAGAPGSVLHWRQVLLSAAVAVWALRLGSYLFSRILQAGSDSRFDRIKHSPGQFLGAFVGQAAWVAMCTLPVLAVNSVPASALAALPPLRGSDVVGLALFVFGLGFETVADRQKSRWLAEKNAKIHDEEFMTHGLWSKSQYPNYFGEITLWTGLATMAAGVLRAGTIQSAVGLSGGVGGQLVAAALSFASPMFSYLVLTRLSGIPMSEKKYDKRYGSRKDYQEWKKNTPRLFPKLS